MSKGKAYIMCFFAIIGIFGAMFVIGVMSKEYRLIPVSACLTALCSITGGYIGLQIANNGVKGKYWNSELYDRENGGENMPPTKENIGGTHGNSN